MTTYPVSISRSPFAPLNYLLITSSDRFSRERLSRPFNFLSRLRQQNLIDAGVGVLASKLLSSLVTARGWGTVLRSNAHNKGLCTCSREY